MAVASAPPPAPPSDVLDVSVLGPLRVDRGSGSIVLGGRRQQAVLARLALAAGEAVAAERMVDDLWGDAPPPTATNTLQSYVSNLRRLLGPAAAGGPAIERVGDGYRLAVGGAALASLRFEQLLARATAPGPTDAAERVSLLDDALALWRGPALGDLAGEPWAAGDAARLEELRLAAVEARFRLLLDLGQHALVVSDLDAAAAAHPLREQLTALLVTALYRCGRQAEALRAFERTRRHLAEELGLDPGPDLVRLLAAVAEQDPSLLAPSPPADPSPTPAATPQERARAELVGRQLPLPPAVAERRSRSTFVGRTEELAALEAAWAQVVDPRGGGSRLVTVSGEPGMGKTRLAQQLSRSVHAAGGHVLWGRCSVDQLIAYQPVVEALRTAIRSLDPRFGPALLSDRPALAPFIGGPGEDATDVAGAGIGHRGERYELFEALAALLGDVTSGAPVLLVVDDLQWADSATLALLDLLLHHARTGRVLVLGTVRRPTGRPTPALDRFLTDVRRSQRLVPVALGGFGPDEVGELLAGHGVAADDGLAATVHGRTGGNPFFVESLVVRGGDLAADDRSVPESIREVFDQRLAALDPDLVSVLTAAAVIGLRVELDLLATVADVDADAVLDVVDAAVAAGLLVEDEDLGWVAFPHALVRQALVARLSRNREALLNLRVADAIAARPRGLERDVALAQHLVSAGPTSPPQRTAAAALDASLGALSVVADEEAWIWATRALDALGPPTGDPVVEGLRAEALLLTARATRYLGRLDESRQAAGRVVELARAAGDGLLLMRAAQESSLLAGAVGFTFSGLDEELIALLDEALTMLGPEHTVERAALLAWSSLAQNGGDDRDLQERLSIEAMEAIAGVPGRRQVHALTLLARRMAVGGPAGLDERLALARPLREAASGWTELEAVARILEVNDLLEVGRTWEAEAALDALRAFVAPVLRPALDTYVAFFDSVFALLHGDLDRAQERSDHALDIGAPAHGLNAATAWAGQQFMLARERGTLSTLRDELARLVVDEPYVPVWGAGLAACLVEEGDLDGARSIARSYVVGGRLTIDPRSVLRYVAVALLAEVCWATSDRELAEVLLVELAPIAHRVAVAGLGAACLGHLVRHQGLVLAVLGERDGALAQLALASELAVAAGWPAIAARADRERQLVHDLAVD